MADKRDYYEVLGIPKNADAETIKKVYRQLAKKYHPDINPGNKEAELRFKEINEAYEVLSDPEKKAKYDQFGHAAFDPTAGGGGFSGFSDFDLGDIGDLFGSFFSGFGGSTQTRRGTPVRGDDLGVKLSISFEEAVFGVKKDISYNRVEHCSDCSGTGAAKGTKPETCQACHGTGMRHTTQRLMGISFQSTTTCEQCRGTGKVVRNPCSNCRGTGFVRLTKHIRVSIPAGIDDGNKIIQRGLGNEGRNGGPAGDLIIMVSVRKHSIFTRNGNNIHCEVPVTVTEAILGAEIDVPTLEGSEKFTIPEGTQPGTSFTMKSRGIPYVNSPGRRGDLIFTVSVEIPHGLSSRQKEHIRSFAESCGEHNYAKRTGFFKKFFNKK
ncbi:MAG: molecular chaperone DnaJ [Eubacteriales bacterium]|jgi:molecular chaperone DnaJ